jgi:hypothetical protein
MRLCAVVSTLALPLAAHATTVEATGEAELAGGKVAAKQAAVTAGLKGCVEKAVGITVQSEFSSVLQETVKNNQNEFNANVRDQVLQNSEGFVKDYKVLSEKAEGGVYVVALRCEVYESKLKMEIQKLTDLIAAAGNPKIMIIIQDVLQQDGNRQVGNESTLAANLEEELLARGFELKGKSVARRLGGETIEAYDAWMADTERVMAAAREAGADILVFGRVQIADKGVIEDAGGLSALKGQRRIEIQSNIRGVNAGTGEQFSSKPVTMSSIGINMERAAHRAFKGRGENVVKQTFDALFEDLKASFKKMANEGRRFEVHLTGVTSFRKQGQPFIAVLAGIDGIANVKQKGFDDGTLRVELSCKCSPAELQTKIFGATERSPSYQNLDVVGVAGARLSFKL